MYVLAWQKFRWNDFTSTLAWSKNSTALFAAGFFHQLKPKREASTHLVIRFFAPRGCQPNDAHKWTYAYISHSMITTSSVWFSAWSSALAFISVTFDTLPTTFVSYFHIWRFRRLRMAAPYSMTLPSAPLIVTVTEQWAEKINCWSLYVSPAQFCAIGK